MFEMYHRCREIVNNACIGYRLQRMLLLWHSTSDSYKLLFGNTRNLEVVSKFIVVQDVRTCLKGVISRKIREVNIS